MNVPRCAASLPLALVAILLVGCGGDDGVDDAVASLQTVTRPVAALEGGPVEPPNGWQGGELTLPEDAEAVPVFVYRPDDVHPEGWLGGDDTVVVRYFTMEPTSIAEACAAFDDWVIDNGGSDTSDCDQVAEPADGDSATSSVLTAEPFSSTDGGDVTPSAVIAIGDGRIEVVFWAAARA